MKTLAFLFLLSYPAPVNDVVFIDGQGCEASSFLSRAEYLERLEAVKALQRQLISMNGGK